MIAPLQDERMTRDVKFVFAAVVLIILCLLGAFLMKVRLLTNEVAFLTGPDREQSLWTATQIQYEIATFELQLKGSEGTWSKEDYLRFDIFYSRLSQVSEAHLTSLLNARGEGDIARRMLALRDEMADLVDSDGGLSLAERASMEKLVADAGANWSTALQYILHGAREERVRIRQQVADVMTSARNYLAVSILIIFLSSIVSFVAIYMRGRSVKFEAIAQRDTLTNCLSRYGLEVVFTSEVFQRASRKTAVVVDLNALKSINDSFGHAAGDLAIKTAARVLQDSMRDTDYIARVGGDEFWLVIMAEQSFAEMVMERAATALRKFDFLIGDSRVSLSMSYGTHYFGTSNNVELVFAEADKRMYAHKSQLRNQTFHDDGSLVA